MDTTNLLQDHVKPAIVRGLAAGALLLGTVGVAACAADDNDVALDDDTTTTVEIETVDDFPTLDANGDSYLDADEVAERVDDVGTFEEWDVDSDSELDRDDIAGNAFDLWDADDNGKVSEAEWEDGTEFWYPVDENPDAFADWDGDGDSELDVDEVSESLDISIGGEMWDGENLEKDQFKEFYFDLYDADDDGKVTEEEWTDGAALHGTPAE